MDKHAIADIFAQIALIMEIKGENPFKIRAYQNGARILENLPESLESLIAADRLGSIPGLGSGLVASIFQILEEGRSALYDELKASIPPGMLALLDIPGLGPKKIKKLYEALGVSDIAGLKKVCELGQVAELPGFGKKSADKLLEGIVNLERYRQRHLWWDAFAIAEPILQGLQQLPQVQRASHAGSLRRGMETVGDLDFLVASDDPAPIMEWFVSMLGVHEVTANGQTKSSVRLTNGLQADLRVVQPRQFFYALHHFTGSKQHNVAMRSRALERGLSLSEWGLAPKDAQGKMDASQSLEIDSEEALFRQLDLQYIVPELREDLGEIQAAEIGKLPNLIEEKDIQGALHVHTTASDGRHTLEEMAAGASARGWRYLGITDHSRSSYQANGLYEDRLMEQVSAIRALNESKRFPVHVFSGTECDILAEGALDYSEAVLRQLDLVIVSVHNGFSKDSEVMTQRIIRAIEHPGVNMLGHLTGRLLLRREPYGVDVERVIDAAIANRVVIELNANPHRLDMDWRHWRRAAERGLLCSINPDAHDLHGFDFISQGVRVARKGWLTAESVVNTWSLERLTALLKEKK
jgi:DNA polymerase (family 10)